MEGNGIIGIDDFSSGYEYRLNDFKSNIQLIKGTVEEVLPELDIRFDKMKIAALIPARSGSVRVIDKKVKMLEGDPLIGRKIKQLQSSCVDEIFLGSNDNKYLEIAEQYGATLITRSEFSCDERVSTSNDMIADFVKRIPNTFDLIVWAHCANPFYIRGITMTQLI